MIEHGTLFEGTPFKEQLVSSGFVNQVGESQNLMVLNSAPEKIIRVGWLALQQIADPDPLYNYYVNNRDILNRLRDHYGIAIPGFTLVLGAYEEEPRFYTVTERVHGPRLSDKVYPQEIELAKDKLELLFSGLVRYFSDISKNGGWYIPDLVWAGGWLGTAQYIFGRTQKNPEEKIYFVDLGPNLELHDVDDITLAGLQLPRLFSMVTEVESKLGLRLPKIRESLFTFLDTLPTHHRDLPVIETLRQELNSK